MGDAAVFTNLNRLLADTMRDPFKGLGKPEPLRGEFSGWWSRRLTLEHRLVYRVRGTPPEQLIEVAIRRGHY